MNLELLSINDDAENPHLAHHEEAGLRATLFLIETETRRAVYDLNIVLSEGAMHRLIEQMQARFATETSISRPGDPAFHLEIKNFQKIRIEIISLYLKVKTQLWHLLQESGVLSQKLERGLFAARKETALAKRAMEWYDYDSGSFDIADVMKAWKALEDFEQSA